MNRIRKGDTVRVIAGNDRGKKGEVNAVLPKQDRVIVRGVNLVKKHQRRTGDVRTQAGIIEREGSLHVSNVMVVCKNCGEASRMGFKTFDDGKKGRLCKNCGQPVD